MPPKLQQVTQIYILKTPNTNTHPQMNQLVESAMAALPPHTLLIVMGDHGVMCDFPRVTCDVCPSL